MRFHSLSSQSSVGLTILAALLVAYTGGVSCSDEQSDGVEPPNASVQSDAADSGRFNDGPGRGDGTVTPDGNATPDGPNGSETGKTQDGAGGSETGTAPDGIAGAGGSGVDAGPIVRVAFSRLPERGGPVTNPWSNGEPRVLKDRTAGMAGDLFGFGWADKLYLFRSGDLGGSWHYADPAAGQTVGTQQPLCAAQDSTGKVHLLFKDGAAGQVVYARVALTYTDGHIGGFSPDVQGIPLPTEFNTNVDVRGVLQVVSDLEGHEVLVYEVNDVPGSGFRMQMGQATSLTPSTSVEFVGLDGRAGATVAYSTSAFHNHDHNALFAQLGASHDLWVFWGPIDAEFGAPDDTFITRLPVTATGSRRWTVGSPVTMVGSDEIASPEIFAVYGSRDYVWLMYSDPTDGLSFDRVTVDGSLQHAPIPSPEPLGHRNGWGVFSAADDGSRIWAIWNTMSRNGPGVDDKTIQAVWDGSAWTTFSDPMVGDSWGMGSTLGWNGGVVATRVDNDYGVAVSTIRGGP